MEIESLKNRPEITTDEKLSKKYGFFRSLLTEIGKREIPEDILNQINERVHTVNSFQGPVKGLKKVLRKEQYGIIQLLEKELKLVPKGHYRNMWMAIGMSAFGVSMGAAFGVAFDNMAFLGMGIPMGMAIGIAIGTGMDEKAAKEGRQLSFEAS
ncbi:MAG: hypothetical protein KTR30_12370 [Saprospiraceae bacterium]|nr:hypothetical protein [Saprospiraceae bacterium]